VPRPPVPADVRRRLRQEAGFGCCVCGFPIYDYQHIVPYSVRAHFDPPDMMILCPNLKPFRDSSVNLTSKTSLGKSGFKLKPEAASGAAHRHGFMGVNVNKSCWNARLSTTPWALKVNEFRQRHRWLGPGHRQKRMRVAKVTSVAGRPKPNDTCNTFPRRDIVEIFETVLLWDF